MCGIVAVTPSPTTGVAAALRALQHRGPDGSGTWESPAKGASLGHTRLAIMDPGGGHQPIANEDETVFAVVNGELYDFEGHARALASRGHRFRSRSDAELLVHLYEEHGEACLDFLRGEFAFALWDERRRRLFVARDRMGVKPLVWARLDGGFAFASEAKALFALGVPATWDDEAFFHAAHTQYLWPDRTLFAGIRQIAPGHAAFVEDGELRAFRYWDIRYDGGPSFRSEDEAIEGIRAALEEAVRLRTVADANVAAQLSGGLDSSAVAALAARTLGRSLRCFTVGFDDGRYDERALAAGTASHLGLECTVVPVSERMLVDTWAEAVAHGEGLAINGHIVGKYLLSRAMRQAGYKVALTGEGSDEVLAGYAHLRQDALEGRGGNALGRIESTNAVSKGLMLPDGETMPLEGVRARLGFVPTWLAAKASLGRRVRSLLSADWIQRFAGEDPFVALVDRTEAATRLAGRPRVHVAAYTWAKSCLAQYILRTLGDAMEMAHGVEGRVPFLDHVFIEVATRIPPHLLVSGDIDKPLLRKAMSGVVPEVISRRPKHPFLAPPLCKVAPTLVQDTLRTHARGAGFVDRDALTALLDRLPTLSDAEQQAWDPPLMLLLSACILRTRYRA